MSENNKGILQFVGVDDGHYGIKICAGEGKYVHIKSRATYGVHQSISINGTETSEDNIYNVDGVTFTVIDDVIVMNNQIIDPRNLIPEYPLSDLNCSLVFHALIKAGFNGGDHLAVVTGLPFMDYFRNGKKNLELIEAKRKNFNRVVTNFDENITLPSIDYHNVLAEGMGGYFDLLLNFDGTQNEEIVKAALMAPIVIVDIGGKTTDIATVGENRILSETCATINIGALDFNNTVSQNIMKSLGLTSTMPHKIENAIKTGKYVAYNKEHDVTEIIEDTKMIFARKIQELMYKTINKAQDLGLVTFIGGGTNLIQPQLEKLYQEQSYFVKNPEFSNARGFYKAQYFLKDWK